MPGAMAVPVATGSAARWRAGIAREARMMTRADAEISARSNTLGQIDDVAKGVFGPMERVAYAAGLRVQEAGDSSRDTCRVDEARRNPCRRAGLL